MIERESREVGGGERVMGRDYQSKDGVVRGVCQD